MNVEVGVESLFESLVLDVNTRIVSYTYTNTNTIPFTSSQLMVENSGFESSHIKLSIGWDVYLSLAGWLLFNWHGQKWDCYFTHNSVSVCTPLYTSILKNFRAERVNYMTSFRDDLSIVPLLFVIQQNVKVWTQHNIQPQPQPSLQNCKRMMSMKCRDADRWH